MVCIVGIFVEIFVLLLFCLFFVVLCLVLYNLICAMCNREFCTSALVMLVQPAVSSVPAGDLGDPEYKVARQPLRHCHDQEEEED